MSQNISILFSPRRSLRCCRSRPEQKPVALEARAAVRDGRLVTVGPLVLFSTETGDAWLLDPADNLAARVARDGDPEDVYFEETEKITQHILSV